MLAWVLAWVLETIEPRMGADERGYFWGGLGSGDFNHGRHGKHGNVLRLPLAFCPSVDCMFGGFLFMKPFWRTVLREV